MTALTLNLRAPLIVVAGAFNPAIFTPQWVATNVFDVPVGAEMSVLEVIMQPDPQSVLQLRFIDGVALNALPNRLELYSVDGSDTAFEAVESALIKILELLPHTPIGAIGCNLLWDDTDPSSEILDLFDSAEGLEGIFAVEARHYRVAIDLDDKKLNLDRLNVGSEVQYRFNYHRPFKGIDSCLATVKGMIAEEIAHSTQIMRERYSYEGHLVLSFDASYNEETVIATEVTK